MRLKTRKSAARLFLQLLLVAVLLFELCAPCGIAFAQQIPSDQSPYGTFPSPFGAPSGRGIPGIPGIAPIPTRPFVGGPQQGRGAPFPQQYRPSAPRTPSSLSEISSFPCPAGYMPVPAGSQWQPPAPPTGAGVTMDPRASRDTGIYQDPRTLRDPGALKGAVGAIPGPARPGEAAASSLPERFSAPGFPGIDCVPSPLATMPEEEPLSAIEADFEESAADPGVPTPGTRLRQFGYDVFRNAATTFAPVEDVPVGPDYILGPGDGLTVYVWGLVEDVFADTVNRNGEIFIPRIGTLKVWGLTFEKAERLIREQLAKVYTGFQISVTLGRLRTIRVFVVGAVARPGSYTLSPLSTVTNALFAAGGPSKSGTLRRIGLIRNNRTVSEIDLYEFLLRGEKMGDVRLESGDTIFVPQIGSVVGLTGRVNQAAIYEIANEARVADLLKLAGGVTPRGYLERVQIERFRANRERVVLDVDLYGFYERGQQENNLRLLNGDLVRVFPVDLMIYNAVAVEGLVRRPGRYELRPGLRVGDLLLKEELLPDAYLEQAEVVRLRVDQGTEVIPFNIRDAWAGKPEANIELKSLDRVVVRSQMRPVEEVTVAGMIRRPGAYAIAKGDRISTLIERAGGLEPGAFPKGAVFIRQSVMKIEKQQLEQYIRTQEQSLLSETSAIGAGATDLSSVAARSSVTQLQVAVVAQRRELLKSLAMSVTLGRIAIRLDEAVLKNGLWDIDLERGDSLYIPPEPKSVLVLGAVRNSTAILHSNAGQDVAFYIAQAGGMTRDADQEQMYVLKPDGTTVSSFVKLYKVEPGDAILIPISTEPKVRTLPLLRDIAVILAGFTLPFATVIAAFK
jgi:polysaccharide export outer membrane protein